LKTSLRRVRSGSEGPEPAQKKKLEKRANRASEGERAGRRYGTDPAAAFRLVRGRLSRDTAQQASKTPTTPPTSPSTKIFREKLSHDAVSAKLPALPARQSLFGESERRVSCRFAIFAQAISNKKPTAASIIRRPNRWSPRSTVGERLQAKTAVLNRQAGTAAAGCWAIHIELRLGLRQRPTRLKSRPITFR